ncbi:MAG: hypothetical protein U1E05_06780 [Patescibacteria group bacterium]|nr:hypothetical protein [Patescibacteria group bacterium]
MYSRWVNLAIIMLWLATMGWLLKYKVLPTFEMGDPPNQQSVADAGAAELPIGWTLAVNGRSLGWALTTTTRHAEGVVEVSSHVHFDDLPLRELAPGWLQALFRSVEESSLQQAMDARSVLLLNSLGRLTRFESTVGMESVGSVVSLSGEVVGSQVMLAVRSGDFVYRSEAYLPNGALLGDALQPQARLAGLRLGQTWTVPVYSPFRPPGSPLEIMQAEVEGEDMLPWNGKLRRVWLVVYTSDPGAGLLNRQEARGRLWVSREGDVLRQEVGILGATIAFTRVLDHEAIAMRDEAAAKEVRPPDSAPIHEETWPLTWPGTAFDLPSSPPDAGGVHP